MIQSQGNSQLRSQYNRYHWYIGYSKLGKLQETIKGSVSIQDNSTEKIKHLKFMIMHIRQEN